MPECPAWGKVRVRVRRTSGDHVCLADVSEMATINDMNQILEHEGYFPAKGMKYCCLSTTEPVSIGVEEYERMLFEVDFTKQDIVEFQMVLIIQDSSSSVGERGTSKTVKTAKTRTTTSPTMITTNTCDTNKNQQHHQQ